MVTYNVFINKYFNMSRFQNVFQNFSSKPKNITPVNMSYNAHENKKDGGAPVIIMHGLFGSKKNWNSLGKAINEKTKKIVYMVDARNHGDSPHSDDHSYFHLAEDIKLFLTDRKIDKAALVGHSMGGRAVMVFALENKENVESLTVVDISPIVGKHPRKNNFNNIFDKIRATDLKKGLKISAVRDVAESQLAQLIGSKAAAKFLSLNIKEKAQGTFGWKFNLDGLHKAYNEHIIHFPEIKAKFNGPTLFVFGGKSTYFKVERVPEIKQFFPAFSIVTIPNAGHWVHSDKPKEFLEVVCNFINKSKS